MDVPYVNVLKWFMLWDIFQRITLSKKDYSIPADIIYVSITIPLKVFLSELSIILKVTWDSLLWKVTQVFKVFLGAPKVQSRSIRFLKYKSQSRAWFIYKVKMYSCCKKTFIRKCNFFSFSYEETIQFTSLLSHERLIIS